MQLSQYVAQGNQADLVWLILGNKTNIGSLKQLLGLKLSTQYFELFDESDKRLCLTELERVKSEAAQSWLFNLVIASQVPAECLPRFEALFFQLKNVGFCRLINLCGENSAAFLSLAQKFNVYYEDLDLT